MAAINKFCKHLTNAKWFEFTIIAVILVNTTLIGIETYKTSATIKLIQNIILGVFTLEIAARFIARDSIKSFFKSGWNIFDLSLVLVSYVPEALFENASTIMVLRVLRIFRVLRLLRTSGELKLIIDVLFRSISALFYNGIFFFIFIYLFAIIGVSLFKLPDYNSLSPEKQAVYSKLMDDAPNAPESAPDPYGSLGESMFTLFRSLTGDNWSDLRYNLIKAHEYGLVSVSPPIITAFHVVWFILAAFLLLNLVVGAIVNNYEVVMSESKERQRKEREHHKDKALD